jgi:hypothetical protein
VSDLVSTAEQKTFMGVSGTSDDTLVDSLLTMVEDMLERACGRAGRPFSAALTNRIETHDGTDDTGVDLDYPIASVAEILLGVDADNPTETLDPDDLTVVTFGAGRRRLTRTDCGVFGTRGRPRYVQVTYTTQADLPSIAKLAVMRATASIYRQRGSEDAKSETIGGDFSHTLASLEEDPIWKAAVLNCGEPSFA